MFDGLVFINLFDTYSPQFAGYAHSSHVFGELEGELDPGNFFLKPDPITIFVDIQPTRIARLFRAFTPWLEAIVAKDRAFAATGILSNLISALLTSAKGAGLFLQPFTM